MSDAYELIAGTGPTYRDQRTLGRFADRDAAIREAAAFQQGRPLHHCFIFLYVTPRTRLLTYHTLTPSVPQGDCTL